jgi:murein DD-endopeptidase MepM/ murein hydrolase activator NlpD
VTRTVSARLALALTAGYLGLHAPPVRADAVPQGKTVLTLPFEGRWDVVWGGTTLENNYHGKMWPSSRYAYDFVAVAKNGDTYRGKGERPQDYVGYGQPILAPADGTVVTAEDGHPDQPVGPPPPTSAKANKVHIRHANGEESQLLHLQPGSVAVRKDQRVVRGQMIGRCGNSGYSFNPHLHYNLVRRHEGASECLLASFVWLWVSGPAGDVERRRWAPVRGETVWASAMAAQLSAPAAKPFDVRQRAGRIILQQP